MRDLIDDAAVFGPVEDKALAEKMQAGYGKVYGPTKSIPSLVGEALTEGGPSTFEEGAKYITEGMRGGGAMLPGVGGLALTMGPKALTGRKQLWQLTEKEYLAMKERGIGGKLTSQMETIFKSEHGDLVRKAQERGLFEVPKPPIAEPGKVGIDRNKIWSAYQKLVTEKGSKNVEISDLQQRTGYTIEDLRPFIKQESREGRLVASPGGQRLTGTKETYKEFLRPGEDRIEIGGQPMFFVRLEPEFKITPKSAIAEASKVGTRPAIEELSKLRSGRGWVEFESERGTIVQGKINDVFAQDKELWVFPSDRSLLPKIEGRLVLRVPFNKVTRIIKVE